MEPVPMDSKFKVDIPGVHRCKTSTAKMLSK